MKLSKNQIKQHEQAQKILEKDVLTNDEKWFVVTNYLPGYSNQIGKIASFFTPHEMASDMVIECCGDRIIDLCAGIGMLAFTEYERHTWSDKRPEFVCIERNPEFVAVGKKILPEATWICADVIDESTYADLGKFSCVISNPPFGNIKHDSDASWLNYKGSEFAYKVVEIATRLSDRIAFILPQGLCPFKYSGERGLQENSSTGYTRFNKQTGITLAPSCGIDLAPYRDQWVGTNILCEVVTLGED